LQELNLSGNPIKLLEDLSLPQLRMLNLDGCRISVIENLKSCKKLEHISLNGNMIFDLSIQGGAQQLIDLKVLSVSNNRIQ
jgi:Leucine-rich repeat (LRR) protein